MIDFLETWWCNHLNEYGENCSLKLFLGLSGGMDSTVLVAAAAQWLKQRSVNLELLKKYPSPIQIQVIHINHGLHSQSSEWSTKAESLASGYGFECHNLNVNIINYKNLEAAARQARWDAFRAILKTNDVLWLAHHQRDQAETFLLRLMRGSGVTGLGAIHSTRKEQDWFVGRPFLSVSYIQLKNYALENSLEWVEDPSNTNTEFDRNFIRHTILPLLESRWHASAKRITDSVNLLQDAAQVCQDQAQFDLNFIKDRIWEKRGFIVWKQSDFLQLSDARQKNALYQQLALFQKKITNSFSCTVDSVWHQLRQNFIHAKADRHPKIDLGQWEIHRYRQLWFFINKAWYQNIISKNPISYTSLVMVKANSSLVTDLSYLEIKWNFEERVMDSKKINNTDFVWGFSSDTTYFILDEQGHKARHSTFWQSRGIPAWLRNYWPVLFHKDDLTTAIFVPELYQHTIWKKNMLGFEYSNIIFSSC